MALGDSNNILTRIKGLIPYRWFASAAPNRDAILGGLSDLSSWGYSLITYAKSQLRVATGNGPFLDIIAFDFFQRFLVRAAGQSDAIFLTKIQALLMQERVTRAGMVSAITALTGSAPIIFEPWNTGDAGAWDTGAFAFAGANPASGGGGGWDVLAGWDENAECFDPSSTVAGTTSGGAGGWGDTDLPSQTFIVVQMPGVQGVPNVDGFDSVAGGFDQGTIEWTDPSMIIGAVTDQDVFDVINATKPTGSIIWTQLQ
jgi:hypothetical protein